MIELAPSNPYGLSLPSPVVVASGALGYGVEYQKILDWEHIGALITRTTSLHPRRIHTAPQIISMPSGVLITNSDVNPGLRHIEQRCASVWTNWKTRAIVSIGGASAEQCADVATQLDSIEGVAGIEFNLSRFRNQALQAVATVRAATMLPLIVKLPIDEPELEDMAQTAILSGADTISLSGPPMGMHIDVKRGGARVEGWLCGPALRPLALYRTAQLAETLSVPLIAGCGIATLDDAKQFLAAGASAVSIGSALLANPRCANEIAASLACK